MCDTFSSPSDSPSYSGSPSSAPSGSPSQLPPADELAAIRDQIKALEAREAALRAILMSDPSARTGNAYVVEVREVTTRRTDIKELRAAHPDLVDEYTYPVTTTRLDLRGITEDGEVVSLRRKQP